MKIKSMALLLTVMFSGIVTARAQGTFTVLYKFNGSDGNEPEAGVIQDPAGNLYGTTLIAGDLACDNGEGCGLVFRLNTSGRETVLHAFTGNRDGDFPQTPVVRDAAGNLYGTTAGGNGAIYRIDTAGKEKVFYSFTAALMAATQSKACLWARPIPCLAQPSDAAAPAMERYLRSIVRDNLPCSIPLAGISPTVPTRPLDI